MQDVEILLSVMFLNHNAQRAQPDKEEDKNLGVSSVEEFRLLDAWPCLQSSTNQIAQAFA